MKLALSTSPDFDVRLIGASEKLLPTIARGNSTQLTSSDPHANISPLLSAVRFQSSMAPNLWGLVSLRLVCQVRTMSERIALIIDNCFFHDKILSQLKTPETDVRPIAHLLRDPEIGNFNEVEKIVNHTSQEICDQIENLFHHRKRYDLLLLYFSGYVLIDEQGQLYLAAADTNSYALQMTAVSVADITTLMDRSFSRRQILILDCHFCQIIGHRNGSRLGSRVAIAEAFRGRGHGRVVLTGANTVQYIVTGSNIYGQSERSVFTHYLTQGLQTGAADSDQDGQTGLRELFEYAHKYTTRTSEQEPQCWTYGNQDKFIIAHNPATREPAQRIKWNLIFGGTMSPVVTLIIGGQANLVMSVGMASLFALLYIVLYSILD